MKKMLSMLTLLIFSFNTYSVSLFFNDVLINDDNPGYRLMEYVESLETGEVMEKLCFKSDLNRESPEDVIATLNEFVTEGMSFEYLADDEGGMNIGLFLFDEQNGEVVIDDLTLNFCR